jgi:hypothetical protein
MLKTHKKYVFKNYCRPILTNEKKHGYGQWQTLIELGSDGGTEGNIMSE